jgi:hypothetical protein
MVSSTVPASRRDRLFLHPLQFGQPACVLAEAPRYLLLEPVEVVRCLFLSALERVVEAETAVGFGSLVVVGGGFQERGLVDLAAQKLEHRQRPGRGDFAGGVLQESLGGWLVALLAGGQVAVDDGIGCEVAPCSPEGR